MKCLHVALTLAAAGCVSMPMMEPPRTLAPVAPVWREQYVIAERTSACGDASEALTERCATGRPLIKGQRVMTVGEAERGVVKVVRWDSQGERAEFVRAERLAELPELTGFEAAVAEMSSAFPADKQIPTRNRCARDFVEQPHAFDGRVLVARIPTRGLQISSERGRLIIRLPIPDRVGSAVLAFAQLELADAAVAEQFRAGVRTYQCGPSGCDELAFVARLTGKTVDVPSRGGSVVRLPVLELEDFADRFGRTSPGRLSRTARGR